jgi:hypothetical protein
MTPERLARGYTFILVCVLVNGLALAAVFGPKQT